MAFLQVVDFLLLCEVAYKTLVNFSSSIVFFSSKIFFGPFYILYLLLIFSFCYA